MVDGGTGRLAVGPVCAVLVVLVRGEMEVVEGPGELAQRVIDAARLVGVLDPHQVDAAGVDCEVATDHGGVHPPDVHVSRRGGAEPGHLRALRQLPGRVTPRPVVRVRKVGGEEGVDDGVLQHGS